MNTSQKNSVEIFNELLAKGLVELARECRTLEAAGTWEFVPISSDFTGCLKIEMRAGTLHPLNGSRRGLQ